jgi:hypothetical protein
LVARTRFNPDDKAKWGWWWTPELAESLPLDEENWPEYTDDEPWDYSMVCAWCRDQGYPEPTRPGESLVVQQPAAPPPVAITSQPVKRVATETRDADRRARRMKRYMVWWRAKEAAIAQGLPVPEKPAEGFGDPDERGTDEPVH